MEKYLRIKLVGHEYIAAFRNKEKKKPEQPDYKGNGVAIWIREYDPNKNKEESIEADV